MAWGGMVTSMCMFVFVVIGSCCDVQSLRLTISMVIVCASSLAAILARWMATRVVFVVCGYARPIPFHLEDFAWPREPNIISWLWGELYCVINVMDLICQSHRHLTLILHMNSFFLHAIVGRDQWFLFSFSPFVGLHEARLHKR